MFSRFMASLGNFGQQLLTKGTNSALGTYFWHNTPDIIFRAPLHLWWCCIQIASGPSDILSYVLHQRYGKVYILFGFCAGIGYTFVEAIGRIFEKIKSGALFFLETEFQWYVGDFDSVSICDLSIYKTIHSGGARPNYTIIMALTSSVPYSIKKS